MLKLPKECQIHNVFCTSLLSQFKGKPLIDNNPIIVEGFPEYEVEGIVGSRFICRSLQFLVAWKNFLAYNNSWVRAKDCLSYQGLIA